MRITIINFMCYIKKIVDIENDGITLISGWSGVGKSSILQAIAWCLYGKIRGVYNNTNTNICSVTLQFPSFTIYRQGRPNLLKITETSIHGQLIYEDIIAQQIIDNKYGEKNIWYACSYILQKKQAILLSGSNAEKLTLLTQLAFIQDDPDECINRIDNEIKTQKQHFIYIQAEYTAELNIFQTDINANTTIFNYALDHINKKYKEDALISENINYSQLIESKNEQNKMLGEIGVYKSLYLNIEEKLTNIYNNINKYSVLINTTRDYDKELEDIKIQKNEHEINNANDINNIKLNIEECKHTLHKLSSVVDGHNSNMKILQLTYDSTNKNYNNIYTEIKDIELLIDRNINIGIKYTTSYELNKKILIDYITNENIEFDINENHLFTDNDIWNIKNQETQYINMITICNELNIKYENINDIKDIIYKEKENINNSLNMLTKIEHDNNIRDKINNLEYKIDKNIKPINNKDIEISKTKYDLLLSGKDLLQCPYCEKSVRLLNSKIEKADVKYATPNEIKLAHTEYINLIQLKEKNDINTNILNQIESLKSILTELYKPLSKSEIIDIRILYNIKYNKLNNIIIVSKSMYSSELIVKYNKYKHDLDIYNNHNKNNKILVYKTKLNELQLQQNEILSKINDIKNNIDKLSSYNIDKFKNEINTLNNSISNYINQMNDFISKYNNTKNIYNLNENNIIKDKLYNDNNKKELQLYVNQKQENIKELNNTQQYMNILNDKIIPDIDIHIKECYDKISDISNHLINADICNKYYDRQNELTKKRNIIINNQHEIIALNNLRQNAIDLECEQLQSTVNTINSTMNSILDQIFDSPILVKLQLYKTIKSNKRIKAYVNLLISYKGIEYDNINSLSGGESDRISIALIVAMNKTSTSPFLLLDESMDSIHEDARVLTLDAIKSSLSNCKFIIYIGHEDTMGNYDHNITF